MFLDDLDGILLVGIMKRCGVHIAGCVQGLLLTVWFYPRPCLKLLRQELK